MEKQQTAQESLKQLEEIISEINRAGWSKQRRHESGCVHSLLDVTQPRVENAEEAAKAVGRILAENPHWAESKDGEKKVRIEMYAVLARYVEKEALAKTVEQLMLLLKVGAR